MGRANWKDAGGTQVIHFFLFGKGLDPITPRRGQLLVPILLSYYSPKKNGSRNSMPGANEPILRLASLHFHKRRRKPSCKSSLKTPAALQQGCYVQKILFCGIECVLLLPPQTNHWAEAKPILSHRLTPQEATYPSFDKKAANAKSDLLTPRRSIYRSCRRRPINVPIKGPKTFQWHTFHMPVKKDHINSAWQRLCQIRVCRWHVGPMGTMPGNQVSIHSCASTRCVTRKSRL
jgi:hypothetical protein